MQIINMEGLDLSSPNQPLGSGFIAKECLEIRIHSNCDNEDKA
jgi:hypothetical protein